MGKVDSFVEVRLEFDEAEEPYDKKCSARVSSWSRFLGTARAGLLVVPGTVCQ
jgi:hypothetical protein